MSDIVYNFFTEMFLLFQKIATFFLGLIAEAFISDKFSPNLTLFASFFGGDTNFEDIMDFSSSIGFVIVGLIIGYYMFMYFFGTVIEVKDSITTLLFRSVFAVIMVMLISQFSTTIVEFGDEFSKQAIAHIEEILTRDTTEAGKESWERFVDNTFHDPESSDSSEDKLVGEEMDKVVSAVTFLSKETSAPTINIIRAIINIVMYLVVAYQLLKLCFELIKRYITFGSLHMMGPIMGAFICSTDTVQIFTTYLKMYFTQIGIIIGTKLWIKLGLYMMGEVETSLVGSACIIGFLIIGVQLERLLKDMGFSVSNQGMALLDSVITPALIMGHVAKDGFGNGAITLGSAFGNVGAVKMGSVLTGRSIAPSAVAKTMNENFGGRMRQATGGGLTSSQLANMGKIIGEGNILRNAGLGNALAVLPRGEKRTAMQALCNTSFSGLTADLNKKGATLNATGAYDQVRNGIGVEIGFADGNKVQGFISDAPQANGISQAFVDSEGITRYLNTEGMDSDGMPIAAGTITGYEEVTRSDGRVISIPTGPEEFGENPTTGELETGVRMQSGFIVNGDNDASHYQIQTENGKSEQFFSYSGDGDDAKMLCGYVNTKTGVEIGRAQDKDSILREQPDEHLLAQSFNDTNGMFYGLGVKFDRVDSVRSENVSVEGKEDIKQVKGVTIIGTERDSEVPVKIHLSEALESYKQCKKDNTMNGYLLKIERGKKRK